MGLSPRGRGNPYNPVDDGQNEGSIPAWAGEPKAYALGNAHHMVYPRVGGGTCHVMLAPGALSRSIPAWAGEPMLRLSFNLPAMGLSPRGRGNP